MEQVVGQDPHELPGLVCGESMATRLVPTQCVLTIFESVLSVAPSVVYLDDLPGREPGVGHNESDPRKQFPSCHSILATTLLSLSHVFAWYRRSNSLI